MSKAITINGKSVELEANGQSSNGRDRFKATVELADGSKAYVTVYAAAAPKSEAAVKAKVQPKVVKKGEAPKDEVKADAAPALSAEQAAKLQAVLASLGIKL